MMEERGVSPVVGTILLVAITVILAGTVGFFAMQQGTPEEGATAAMSIEKSGTDHVLYHNGGDEVKVTVRNSDGNVAGGIKNETMTAGDSTDFNSSQSGKTLTVFDENTDTVLLRTTVD